MTATEKKLNVRMAELRQRAERDEPFALAVEFGCMLLIEYGQQYRARGYAESAHELLDLLSALDDARAEAASAKSDLCEIIAAYHEWGESASAPDFDAVSDDLGRLCSAIQDAEKVFGGSPVAVRETTDNG